MKIEKDIPIPKKLSKSKSKLVSAMEIGDSLLFDDYLVAKSRCAMIYVRGWKAAIRTIETEDGKKAWRVWRMQ